MCFEADDLDELSSERGDFKNEVEYRNYFVAHLNQSLFISSPFGRLNSYIKAFLDKYVELKN